MNLSARLIGETLASVFPRVTSIRAHVPVVKVALAASVIAVIALGLGQAPKSNTFAASGTQTLPGSSWWISIQEHISQQEYQVTWQEQSAIPGAPAAYHAPNRDQNLRTYFYTEGPKVVRRTEVEPRWVWHYQLSAIGRPGALDPVSQPALHTDGARVEYRRDRLLEWYENRPEGLEQGFLVFESPRGSGPLMLEAKISPDLLARTMEDGQAVEFLVPGGGLVLRYDQLKVTDSLVLSQPNCWQDRDGEA